MDEKNNIIYEKAIKYLVDKELKYDSEILEFTLTNRIYNKSTIYNNLSKILPNQKINVILQLVSSINTNSEKTFPKWQAHLDALKYAICN